MSAHPPRDQGFKRSQDQLGNFQYNLVKWANLSYGWLEEMVAKLQIIDAIGFFVTLFLPL